MTSDEGGPFGAVMEGQPGGTWRVSHSFDGEQARRLELRQLTCNRSELSESLYRSVAVVETPRGEHVLVAMGSEGALHLSPDSDEWERVQVGFWSPSSIGWPSWFDRLGWFGAGLVGLAAVAILALTILRWRAVSWGGLLALLALGASVVVLVPIWLLFEFMGFDYGVKGLVLSGASIAAVALSALLMAVPQAVEGHVERQKARRAPPLWFPPQQPPR